MTDFIPVYTSFNHIMKFGLTPSRARGYVWADDFNREGFQPTGYPTIYTTNETGAAGASTFDGTVNRINMVTDATGAGDDQDIRTSGIRIERDYCSLAPGMSQLLGMATSVVQIDLPFSLTSAANVEGFIGIHENILALTALPTTNRHMGIYWDISAGANFMLTSSNDTTQVTTDTTIPVDTAIYNLRITWTGEDAATLQLYTAAGVTTGTGQTVAAFNLTSGASHQIHWFVQTETNAGKTLRVYPYRVAWS